MAILLAALTVIVSSILMLLIRVLKGPTVFDKILAANVIGTNIILLICFLGFYDQSKDYIDIALVYAFLNFVATIGFLRYFRYGFNK